MKFSPLSGLLMIAVLAVAAFASLSIPVVAMAQEIAIKSPALTVGDLVAPWLQTVLALVGLALTALIAWLAAMIKSRTGFEIESKHREALQTALLNGTGLILNTLKEKLDSQDVNIRNQAIREAVIYVNENAADAVSYFLLDNTDLATKVKAKLGLAAADHLVTNITNQINK